MIQAARIFGSHMVLQQEKEIKIWGTASPGQLIEGILELENQKAPDRRTATADVKGRWQLCFLPKPISFGVRITMKSGRESLVWEDILIGEVWIAGGQSNMEYPLELDAEKKAVLEGSMYSGIRFFDVPEISYQGEERDYDYGDYGFWRRCTIKDLPFFSAVGYYFAQALSDARKVPVGIVGCNWGGTACHSWTDPKRLVQGPGAVWFQEYEAGLWDGLDLEEERKRFCKRPENDRTDLLYQKSDAWTKLWRRIMYPGANSEEELKELEASLKQIDEQLKTEEEMQGQPCQKEKKAVVSPYSQHRPGALYEHMVKKIAPYPIRGVLWYQGESDHVHAKIYKDVLEAMIFCWRSLWREELPFLLVQLAPFGQWIESSGSQYPILRRCQEDVARKMPGVYLASASDSGMPWDVHPKHKRPIGLRLALLARKYVYQEDILADAPVARAAYLTKDGARVVFEHGDGLHIIGDVLECLQVLDGQGEPILISNLKIRHGDLHIVNSQIRRGARIRFAMEGYYKVNLYNKAGLPGIPFEVVVE